jgi:uncharacterized protein (DUF58 family)
MAQLLHPAALQNLELLARQVVEGFIIGLHKSPFHGFSVEFAEHRLYNVGDPLRHVDWKVYGRTDKLFVKRFEEETNLRCCLAIDVSSSMHFPQDKNRVSKLQFATVASAALLQLLKRQLDASALALFDEGLQTLTDCRSSHRHYRVLTAELERLLSLTPENRTTNAAAALHEIADRLHQRSLVIIFTDGLESGADADAFFAALQHLRHNKHEIILFHILDRSLEREFQFENRPYEFVDLESGEKLRIQPTQVREAYLSGMKAFEQDFEDRCHQYRIDRVSVDLTEPVETVLHAFLARRNKLL